MSSVKKALPIVLVPFAVVLFGGFLFGGIGFLIGKVLPLLLVAPIVIGTAIGLSLKLAFTKKQTTSPLFAIIAIVCMSCVSYGTMYFAKYQDFKQNISEHVLPENTPRFLSKIVQAVGVPLVDDFFEMKTGHSGFAGYMIFSAEEPIEAGFGKVLELGVVAAWIIRIVELALMIALGTFIVTIRKEP